MKDFYLTLPSNSSMDVFRSNTAAKYTTKLHQTIEFKGEWEVGLAEIIFPMSFYNIREGYNTIDYYESKSPAALVYSSDLNTVSIPAGNYNSIDSILNYLNRHKVFSGEIILRYDENTSFVEAKNSGKLFAFCRYGIDQVLGFDASMPMIDSAQYPANLYKQVPQQLFVYSDIVEPQLVGDTSAPLVRIIGIEQKSDYGKVIVKTYESPHYLPLLKRQFETIEIDIRDSTGASAPFQYGPVIVKLHFKQYA